MTDKLFIRIGDIPETEQANIYDADWNIVDHEAGVSVYECILNAEGQYQILMPYPPKEGQGRTWDRLCRALADGSRPMRLVTGDIVGKGQDNEYLLRNVKTVKILDEKEPAYRDIYYVDLMDDMDLGIEFLRLCGGNIERLKGHLKIITAIEILRYCWLCDNSDLIMSLGSTPYKRIRLTGDRLKNIVTDLQSREARDNNQKK